MENNVSQAIRDEDVATIEYLVSQGFNLNLTYDFSIGCVSLLVEFFLWVFLPMQIVSGKILIENIISL